MKKFNYRYSKLLSPVMMNIDNTALITTQYPYDSYVLDIPLSPLLENVEIPVVKINDKITDFEQMKEKLIVEKKIVSAYTFFCKAGTKDAVGGTGTLEDPFASINYALFILKKMIDCLNCKDYIQLKCLEPITYIINPCFGEGRLIIRNLKLEGVLQEEGILYETYFDGCYLIECSGYYEIHEDNGNITIRGLRGSILYKCSTNIRKSCLTIDEPWLNGDFTVNYLFHGNLIECSAGFSLSVKIALSGYYPGGYGKESIVESLAEVEDYAYGVKISVSVDVELSYDGINGVDSTQNVWFGSNARYRVNINSINSGGERHLYYVSSSIAVNCIVKVQGQCNYWNDMRGMVSSFFYITTNHSDSSINCFCDYRTDVNLEAATNATYVRHDPNSREFGDGISSNYLHIDSSCSRGYGYGTYVNCSGTINNNIKGVANANNGSASIRAYNEIVGFDAEFCYKCSFSGTPTTEVDVSGVSFWMWTRDSWSHYVCRTPFKSSEIRVCPFGRAKTYECSGTPPFGKYELLNKSCPPPPDGGGIETPEPDVIEDIKPCH